MIAAPQASRLLTRVPPTPLQAQHFRRVSLRAVPCIAPQVGGSPKAPPPKPHGGFPPSQRDAHRGKGKRGSSPFCSRYAAAGGLMLGFPFRDPPLKAATRLQWGCPPLQAQHFRRVPFYAAMCIAPHVGGLP
jgi:hypothetical protein